MVEEDGQELGKYAMGGGKMLYRAHSLGDDINIGVSGITGEGTAIGGNGYA